MDTTASFNSEGLFYASCHIWSVFQGFVVENKTRLDDVISTGESLAALEALVNKAGGNICGRMAILAEGEAQKRRDLIYLEKLPLFNPDGSVMR